MKYRYILGIYGIICLFTAMVMASGSEVASKAVNESDRIIGPIKLDGKNSVLNIEIKNTVEMMRWRYVGVDVLDSKQDYLFGFGDELWSETGRDSDGQWTERKKDFDMDITIPNPGTYYLEVSSESNSRMNPAVNVVVSEVAGSAFPFIVLGILALLYPAILIFTGLELD